MLKRGRAEGLQKLANDPNEDINQAQHKNGCLDRLRANPARTLLLQLPPLVGIVNVLVHGQFSLAAPINKCEMHLPWLSSATEQSKRRYPHNLSTAHPGVVPDGLAPRGIVELRRRLHGARVARMHRVFRPHRTLARPK